MNSYKPDTGKDVLKRCVVDCEKMVIMHTLIKTKGDQSEAAELLGTTTRALAHKVQKYGIDCEELKLKSNINVKED